MRVPVAERSTDAGRLTELVTPQNAIRQLGVLAIDLTPAVADLLPDLRRDKGVVVAAVGSESPYSQQGKLAAGDVIYSLNGRLVETVGALRTALAALAPNAAAVLQIERDGTLMYFAFRVEPR